MKRVLLGIVVLFLGGIVSASYDCSSVTQYGITWTFDKEYQCGEFANGDYYVIDEGERLIKIGRVWIL